MDNKTLAQAVRKIRRGYLFIFIAINFITVDLLPDPIGYIMIIGALPVIAEKEKSAILLKPLGAALAVWSAVVWFLGMFSIEINANTVNLLISVVKIYFDFQLITNISELAPDGKQKRKIRILRNAVVIAHTVLSIFILFPMLAYAALAAGVVQFVMFFWIFVEFRRLANTLETAENESGETVLQQEENENQTDNRVSE